MYLYRCYEMQGNEGDNKDYCFYEIGTNLNNEQFIVRDKIDISPNK